MLLIPTITTDDPNARGAEPPAHPKHPGALRARANARTAFEDHQKIMY